MLNTPLMIGTTWMVGTLLSFMLMAIGARELSGHLSTFQILFFRSAVGFILVSGFLFHSGWKGIRTRNGKLHFLRNIAHFLGQYGWFYGIAFIPLADVFAIEFTAPIWTAIFATLILKENLNYNKIIAITLGVVGVLVILRPGFEVINSAAIVVMFSAIFYALAHTLTKKLTVSEAPLSIIFYMTTIQLIICLFPSIDNWVTPKGVMWVWIILVGFTALSAHYCMAKALFLADVTIVVPLDFLRLPLIAIVGFALYNEEIDWLVLVGGGIMLLGNIINVYLEKKHYLKSRKNTFLEKNFS